MKISDWLSAATDSHSILDHYELSADFSKQCGLDGLWPTHTIAETRLRISNDPRGGTCDGSDVDLVCYGWEVAEYFACQHVPGFKSWQMGRGFRWRTAVEALKQKDL